ncbi:MAG: DNA-3-methyladenine glycosylase [Verrucomicrobia bacterium]|nr:DNA-3-methyladenine glycosylase [Verrucomicrobiota bacterium]
MKYYPLTPDYFLSDDVVAIARSLIGKHLFSTIGGELTGGRIIETEAYRGPDDRACHAFGGRRTKRTEVMFHEGGVAYVYLCYGIHPLLNVVTGPKDHPHAVLIRALKPTHGLEIMRNRRGNKENLCRGPGVLTQALGITLEHNGLPLCAPPLWVEERETNDLVIQSSPRIGVDYAGEDALLPWRFFTCLSH